jgi:hypothetical protein
MKFLIIFAAVLTSLTATQLMASERICTLTESYTYQDSNLKIIVVHYSEPAIDDVAALEAKLANRPITASMGRRVAFPLEASMDQILEYVQEMKDSGFCKEIKNNLSEQ